MSERYGYSLRPPDDEWLVVERRGEWLLGTTFTQDGPGVDTLLRPRLLDYRHDVFLNSQPLPTGSSFEEWLEAYDQLRRYFPSCDFDDEFEYGMVNALTGDRLQIFRHVPARIGTAVCNSDRWAEAIWADAGRVYVLRVGEHLDSTVPIDPRREIEVWLERITLHGAAASAEFRSERYRYSLALPDDGWTVLERPGEWQPGHTFTGADPGVDVVTQTGHQPGYLHDVVISSQPMDDGVAFGGWLDNWAAMQRRDFPNCEYDDDFEMTSADNMIRANAYIWTAVCNGDRWAEAIWQVDFISQSADRRVYILRIGENRASEVQIDPRQELEVWLDRIEITGRHW